MSLTNCRFYEEKYPEIESFVMVNVKQVWSEIRHSKLLLTFLDSRDGRIRQTSGVR
jgi:hypothetical protein